MIQRLKEQRPVLMVAIQEATRIAVATMTIITAFLWFGEPAAERYVNQRIEAADGHMKTRIERLETISNERTTSIAILRAKLDGIEEGINEQRNDIKQILKEMKK